MNVVSTHSVLSQKQAETSGACDVGMWSPRRLWRLWARLQNSYAVVHVDF